MSNQSADRIFDALGEPVRRRILEVLGDGPHAVVDIAERVPVGRPAVSKHLRVLGEAGLVERTPRGTRNLYALAPAALVDAQRWLVETWDEALAGFADAVRSRASATSATADTGGGEPA